jgi:hypothetical protein
MRQRKRLLNAAQHVAIRFSAIPLEGFGSPVIARAVARCANSGFSRIAESRVNQRTS